MTIDLSDIPDGIGPHEDVEYQLMLEGQKHLAMFSDLIPDTFIDNPSGLPLDVVTNQAQTCTVFYLTGHRGDAERLLAINEEAQRVGFVPEIEQAIGRLLGYKDWEIDAFLKHVLGRPET